MTVGAIVLAAGLSRRMGRNKLLEPISGKSMISYILDTIAKAGLDPPIIALGHQHQLLTQYLRKYSYQSVIVADFELGIAHSLRAAIAAAPANWHAALVCLGDMPFVSAALLRALVQQAATDRIVIPTASGRRGNPVLWGRAYFDDLQALSGDVGGKRLFARYASKIIEFETGEDAIHSDVDTIADLPPHSSGG